MAKEWTVRWGFLVRPGGAPGVLVLKDGGFLVHGKIGRKKRLTRVVRDKTLREAQAERLEMLAQARLSPPASKPLFAEYAKSLYERKVAQRELKSAKTRERWDTTLRLHLGPAFGSLAVDAIGKLDVEAWKTRVAKKIAAGTLSPRTANGWLSILRVVLRAAIDDYALERDPTLRVRDFSTAEHPTYTDEKPNALSPTEARRFLAEMDRRFPQFYAITLLGFVTGLRPSTLRPLRRRGKEPDVLWSSSTLLVRRSNSLGQEVMNTTKTEVRFRICLPRSVMAALERHVKGLRGRRRESELLFPSKRAGLMSRSALDKPFAAVSKAIGLPFTLTPRGMRRSYQDLGRSLHIEKRVRKAICGHKTDAMSDHYETVPVAETRAAVERLVRSLSSKPRKRAA